MKYLSREQVDHLAVEALRAYRRETGRAVEPPISVDLIGELLYDLQWEYALLDGQGPSTLAALYPQRRIVRLNELHVEHFTRSSGLERFTKGHEIGHWVLHVNHSALTNPPLVSSDDGERIFCRDDKTDWTERQADWFAASLLMPEELVLRTVRQYGRLNWSAIRGLADVFDASKEAMRIRLERLGLIFVDDSGRIHRSKEEYFGQRALF